MKIAVINESFPRYNFAVHKMKKLFVAQGHTVEFSRRADMWAKECDKAYVSVIFTWDLPKACQDINNLRAAGVEVEVGGPAATAMPAYVFENTGVMVHQGLDERFEHVRGDDYRAVFTSRGCPRACGFCIVQKMEGRKMIEYEDYDIPAGKNPYVCDNNILLTSWAHQQTFVDRMRNVKNLDLNSGFDDRVFMKDMDRYWDLYRNLKMESWRFAYDKPEQRNAIKICSDFLHTKGIEYRKITVFALVGWDNDSFVQARERLQYLVDLQVSPYPMRFRPLDSVERNYIPPGWVKGQMEMLFAYYGVAPKWRSHSWEKHVANYKKKKEKKEQLGTLQMEGL